MTSVAAPFPAERTAIVTGAASERGIGRVTAERLASEGWSVAVLDLEADAAKSVAASIAEQHSVPTYGVGASIADEEQVWAAVDEIEANLPTVVGLANIAGVSSPTPFLELTTKEWDRVFDVNMRGTYFVTRRVAETMVKNHIGRILSVSSCSARMGGGTFSKVPYSAAKAGIIGFTRAVAREISPLGVTVNAIAPGPVDTDIMGGRLTDDRKSELAAGLLVGRVGTQADIASLIAYLLKEEAGFITGVCYDINGGQTFS